MRPNQYIFMFGPERGFSSAGLEHYLDRVGVVGSNPTNPTRINFMIESIF